MTDRAIAELTALVVETGTNPSLWGDLLPALSNAFPGLKSSIHLEVPGSAQRIAYVDGIERAAVEAYAAHYGALNPWNPFWAKAAPFQARVSDTIAPARLYEATEFYQDWMKRVREYDSAVGMKIITDKEGFGAISLHYGPGLAERYNRDLGAVMQALAGPIRNALALNRQLLHKAPVPAALDAVLEAFDEPTFLLDGSGRIRLQNEAATGLARAATLVRQDRDGRLAFKDRAAGLPLAQALAAMRSFELPPGARAPAPFALRSLDGVVEAFVKVLVIASAGPSASSGSLLFPPARFALVTLYPRNGRRGSADSLRSAFGLTPAEARLALRLQQGESLAEIADALSLSRDTVRQHLKSVFAKTKTNRQAELVLLLSRVP
jgi:DNA-binding CsgD family transcriptional regulator